eukprot:jgi/Chlat1/8445/Chrsp80S07856
MASMALSVCALPATTTSLASAPSSLAAALSSSYASKPSVRPSRGAFYGQRPASLVAQRLPYAAARAGRTQITTRCAGGVLEVNSDNFEQEVLKATEPVLVDFWASWCGPCRLVLPSVEWAAKEYEGKLKVVKIETDGNPTLVEKYKVYGLPTLIIFRDGKKVEASHTEGAITRDKLQNLISEWLPQLA